MKRYKKFVLEVEKGITFEVSEGTSGELIIKALNINGAETLAEISALAYSENYVNPPIPYGYSHVCGEWNNGFVIERNFDGSQFVWIPVGSLDSNGTLDGKSFSEKFGRRNYQNDEFSDSEFNEPLNDELFEQIKSVKKYGGFYISRYNISDGFTGEPQSVKGVKPWVNISFTVAKKVAALFETDKTTIRSHLTFGAEYDSVLEWFIKTGAKTRAEIIEDSIEWGNYWYAVICERELANTGSREEWCVNNIYDFSGNVSELTQERGSDLHCVVRGGDFTDEDAPYTTVACREFSDFDEEYHGTGFRVTLCIK